MSPENHKYWLWTTWVIIYSPDTKMNLPLKPLKAWQHQSAGVDGSAAEPSKVGLQDDAWGTSLREPDTASVAGTLPIKYLSSRPIHLLGAHFVFKSLYVYTLQTNMSAGMAQWIQALATTPDHLGSIPGTHLVGEENGCPHTVPLASSICLSLSPPRPPHTHIHSHTERHTDRERYTDTQFQKTVFMYQNMF